MCALHIPELSSKTDYETFSNWVNSQVANDYIEISTDFIHSNRYLTNSDFIKHVKQMVGNEQLDENDPLDRDVVRYLYLTWTKFYSTSDMAGAILFERVTPLRFLNQSFTLVGVFATTTSESICAQFRLSLERVKPDNAVFAFLNEPAVSGISIHAP